jgi:hypothetical protein
LLPQAPAQPQFKRPDLPAHTAVAVFCLRRLVNHLTVQASRKNQLFGADLY